ncbi:MAG: amidohydrolase family protein [Verrucomicrobia bacterium]|nr:amidohydrolase family protein [Verrucomicrobiota bacterium]
MSAHAAAFAQSQADAEHAPVIDMHVHIVGDGSSGSGCWHESPLWRMPAAAWLAHHNGLPLSGLRGNLDRLFVERLLNLVRESSLDAVVILAQELPYAEDGRVIEGVASFYVPNEYVLKLAREHPEFLPAVSIHPGRRDGMDELERCLAGGAVMMKLLPNCQNIDCSDRRYTKFWERMAEAGLPLLAHTGGEMTLPVLRAEFADPRRLELPLQCGVTVIAAHSGTKSALFDRQHFPTFVEMTQSHPNLYGDNSAFLVLNNRARGTVLRDCLRAPLAGRIVHGSDFPVPCFGVWAWLMGYLDPRTFWKWQRHPNPLERDYQFKRAIGFAPETFTRINRLLRTVKRGEKPARESRE